MTEIHSISMEEALWRKIEWYAADSGRNRSNAIAFILGRFFEELDAAEMRRHMEATLRPSEYDRSDRL